MPVASLPAAFPLYLLPSIPFRRRRSSTESSNTFSSSGSPPTQPTSFLSSDPTSHLRCAKCLTDLIPTCSIISKGFTGRHGRAYLCGPPPPSLFPQPLPSEREDIPNTHIHKAVPRQLVTGAHTVADISCRTCGSVLGWKYVEAEDEAQKYKVGKFILETKRVVKGSTWDSDDFLEESLDGTMRTVAEDDVQFDSQDEDECEDLFAGVWKAKGTAERKKWRTGNGRTVWRRG